VLRDECREPERALLGLSLQRILWWGWSFQVTAQGNHLAETDKAPLVAKFAQEVGWEVMWDAALRVWSIRGLQLLLFGEGPLSLLPR